MPISKINNIIGFNNRIKVISFDKNFSELPYLNVLAQEKVTDGSLWKRGGLPDGTIPQFGKEIQDVQG